MKRLAVVVLSVFGAASAAEAQSAADERSVLQWETPPEVTVLADIGRVFSFRAYLDEKTPLTITPVCTGAAPPFTCEARGVFAGMAHGTRTIRMSTVAAGREGRWSPALTIGMGPPLPGPPANIRIGVAVTDAEGRVVPVTVTIARP